MREDAYASCYTRDDLPGSRDHNDAVDLGLITYRPIAPRPAVREIVICANPECGYPAATTLRRLCRRPGCNWWTGSCRITLEVTTWPTT